MVLVCKANQKQCHHVMRKAIPFALPKRPQCCLQVVAKAKVPIIKFVEKESSVNFDISFDVPNGPIAAGFVRDLMDTLPPMKPLVLVLKIFLQQRAFNEVRSLKRATV